MKEFYAKTDRLEDYGFKKYDKGECYVLKTFRATNVIVDCDSGRMTIYSPSTDMISVLCRMYKNGDLIIKEAKKEDTYRLMLTKKERDLILKRRREKINEQEDRK